MRSTIKISLITLAIATTAVLTALSASARPAIVERIREVRSAGMGRASSSVYLPSRQNEEEETLVASPEPTTVLTSPSTNDRADATNLSNRLRNLRVVSPESGI